MTDIRIGAVAGGSTDLRGYLAVPSGEGPWPGVLVVHEAFGVVDVMRRQADRLAAAGYLTVIPNLYSDGGAARCVLRTMRAMFSGRGPAIADLDAARDHLRADPRCTGKVGVIGFCMGGGFALVIANRGYDVSAPNYGMVPRHAHEALAGACPIVASYGRKDPSLRGAANKLARTLDDLGIEHDVKEYPDAGHSFLNDSYFGPPPAQAVQRIVSLGPEPASAKDAWARIETFFAAHLG